MPTTTDGTGRTPLRTANYSADVSSIVGRVTGPNALGEYMTAIECDFDPETGRSRVGFVFSTVEEVVAEAQRRLIEERGYGAPMPS